MNETTLEVRRTSWHNEDLALICGIANAGGGRLIVAPGGKNRIKDVRKMHRVFEDIPTLTMQTFGIGCAAEPVMDNAQLCLEITVPATAAPLAYHGDYYLYTERGNEHLQGIALNQFLQDRTSAPLNQPERQQNSAPPRTSSVSTASSAPATPSETKNQPKQQSFKDRSIAASRNIYLTSTDEYVLKVLNANGRATAPKIATLLGISESTVRRSFRRLREQGLIERIGSDKAGFWRVLI